MDGHNTDIVDERDALIASLQAHKLQQEEELAIKEKQLLAEQKKNEKLQQTVRTKSNKIESLEERLRALLVKQYGKSSERFDPNQLSFFNEAEVIAASDTQDNSAGDNADDDVTEVKAHKRKRRNTRKPIPDDLTRVDVHHELDKSERQCDHCGDAMERIGEDVNEQLSIVPRQYFVTRHIRGRYACNCKECAKNAPVPTLTFNLSANGAGHTPDDFTIGLINLDDVSETGESSASVVNVNDWGSGFNAFFECDLPGTAGQSIDSFIIDFNYTGSGAPNNAWMNGYNGGIQKGYIAPGGDYGIQSTGYTPPLTTGDTLNFAIQVQGSGFNATDFDVQCLAGEQG